ncbi:MAG: GAF domain-containing protein [Blastochloris sp.]|nr:GAF domain-containing protein [Blastochloris sp.]
MDIAARIGRETALIEDTDQLLRRAVELVCEEFGHYHAQVFLIDDIGTSAALVYSHGEIGAALLAGNYRLPMNSTSIILEAIREGEPILLNDVDVSKTSWPILHAGLTQTRAELVLPLMVAGEVFGAFDIHAAQPSAFQDEEVRALRLLADQFAAAVYNLRRVGETRARAEQADTLNRQLTRAVWEENHRERPNHLPV